MRGCKNGGLRYAPDGSTIDPDVLRAGIGRLTRLCGVPIVDAMFEASLSLAMDPEDMERARMRRHIALGRYGKQPVSQWWDVEGRVVRQYAIALNELLREENEANKAAMKG